MIRRLCALVLSALAFGQCKTIDYTPASYEGRHITFGSGGGITGMINCTSILDNGNIFMGEGLAEMKFEHQGRLSGAETDQLFKNYETLGLAGVQCDRPGNTYRYIEFYDGKEMHRLTWGSRQDLPDENVDLFYNILRQKIHSN